MFLRFIAVQALLSVLLLTGSAAWSQPLSAPSLSAGKSAAQSLILGAEQAFALMPPEQSTIRTEANGRRLLELHWTIAPGHYLYREQLRLRDALGQALPLQIPRGQSLDDAFFGKVQVFHQELRVRAALPERPEQWPLKLQWQGCAEAGICYPVQQQSIRAAQMDLDKTAQATAPAPVNTKAASASPLQALALPASVLIGPLAFPSMALATFVAMFASQWWARRKQRQGGQPMEALLLHATLAGLLAARAAYVVQWWPEYWSSVSASAAGALQILDIRDGGWNLWAGLLAAALWAIWSARKQAPLRRGVLQSLCLGAVILLAAHALRNWVEPPQPPLPALTLVSAGAQPTDLRSYRGQALVVNLWASWCPPCKREMPVLAQAQKDHPEVRFIWINQGEDAATVLRYLQSMPLPVAQVLLDPEQLAGRHWQQRSLPSTYFYDANGQLRSMRMGELSRASLAEQLSSIAPARLAP
ncbi:redoxin family protein [Comamonas sp. Tr-654]|uniref:prolipoprotein diacylglyceryl transferase family protein n=1 Tax=Comamonas sp. Tr-654 TaxID=2608341 RepID=UPI00142005FD|nr:prolipoprotein diacylglyceryl transferase family protein [Comamonas sp. Tr-654]NIF82348.1 redoxin family protein [Comamonas sp. Tr-654]